MLADTKSGQRKSASKTKNLDSFCETHILGIIAHFTNIIESPLAQGKATIQPLSERKRSIGAIVELISLARRNVNGALPQVRWF
jgi:serine/threonine-protein kinase ATR